MSYNMAKAVIMAYVLFWLAVAGGLTYVLFHFVSKFW